MPEYRAVRRLHHSAKAICSELPLSHPINVLNLPPKMWPSVKMKFVNIWNSKLQTQGDCTSTRDGESKEDSGAKWRDFHPEITYEMQSGSGTENLKNLDNILNVTSGVLHFVGDSLVPDTIDKNCLEGAKVPQQEIQKNLH